MPIYPYTEDSDFSPYLESLSKQKRICPKCHKCAIKLKQTLNPNVAYETCECGYFQTISAPKFAEVPWDGKKPWRNPNKKLKAKIIRLSDL